MGEPLGKLVLQDGWTVAGMIAHVDPERISAEIERYEGVRSLMETEPRMDPTIEGSYCAELRKWLKPIGMANWPEATWDRGEWLSATMLALSDLPPRAAISAARQAIHRDFRFPNEVKPAIRDIAAGIVARHRLALHRLKMMRDEIQRAANPQPTIEHQPKLWTESEVEDTNKLFRKLNISTRYRLVGTDVETFEEAVDSAEAQA